MEQIIRNGPMNVSAAQKLSNMQVEIVSGVFKMIAR